MDSNSKAAVTPVFLLFLVFLVLKLTGYISWSWWYVTLPLWGPFILVVAGVILIGAVLFVLRMNSDRS